MAAECSPKMELYFDVLNKEVSRCYGAALRARKKGLDPEKEVSILVAKNMAERVVGLISVVAPQISNTRVTQRILELEKEYGHLDWRVGFKIAEEVALEHFCTFMTKHEAIEVGIRVGFAYLTLGIVSAPLEGFIGIKIKKRRDGKEYFAVQYAGPIRAAGGTAASTSVILSDYVRVKMGYSTYDPEEVEITRYITEVHDYHERVTNLQYHPSDEELRFMLSHLPVEVDGDPTEEFEVSNHKDLSRIETNLIRGGVPLVLAEGLCQKAPKLWKRLSKWGKLFDLEWDWLKDFITLKEQVHAAHASEKDKEQRGGEEPQKVVKANNTFIMDLVAGRPILTHPLGVGGFRLRYGRTRMTGFSSCAVHPATLIVLDKYIAIGTQLKNERPGKGATVTICDVLEGPIVRVKDGSVLQLATEEEAKQWNDHVEEVLFLGDILFNYGDFSENGQSFVPPGYCSEWWVLEFEKSIKENFSGDLQKILPQIGLSEERYLQLTNKYLTDFPTIAEALAISRICAIPLHPYYSLYWKLISAVDLIVLREWLKEGKLKKDHEGIIKIVLPYSSMNKIYHNGKKVLDFIGCVHQIVNNENVVMEKDQAISLAISLNFNTQQEMTSLSFSTYPLEGHNALEIVNLISPIKQRDKAGTFIGARMGRPEKAKMRHLTGSPQVMFPVGEEGDRLRSFQAALEVGKVNSAFPLFYCTPCEKEMIYSSCEECGLECIHKYYCRICGDILTDTCRHGNAQSYKTRDIDIVYYFTKAKERLQEKIHPDLIKGVRGTSNKNHIVEHLVKGILRAKHNIYVNKDGTVRYDCTELPITHFKPKEIKTPLEKLKQLGYTNDMCGQELVDENQIVEIKPQDIILPGFDSLDESAPQVLQRVAQFVDDLLIRFYKLKAFYHIKKEEDLVGHLIIGLAPHISAGLVGRIIGFSETQGLLCHPMFHAGMRRDCDGDEACVMLLMDALLNFSRQYLPEKRGAKTMDSPLVLTSVLNATEIDDQVHGIDVVWRYPLELYEAALEMKNPWEVRCGADKKKIEQLVDRLGTPLQYEQFGYTHPVNNFNKGVQCSAYKTKPSMEEKLLGQMEIASKVRAVDMDDVAKLVIQKHFLKDIKGNLRKFSMQQFRCVKCNEKYRRPPLVGKCTHCGGKLIFTISEGSVVKYLGPSLMLAEKYNFSPYLKQTLELLKYNVDSFFGKEKEKQVGLGLFMG